MTQSNSQDYCATCLEKEIYYFPEENKCYSTCPIGYFKNELINQCSKCHKDCYTCYGYKETECLSCAGLKYLYHNVLNNESRCVDICEEYDTIENNITYDLTGDLQNNLCVKFELNIELYNPLNDKLINIPTFNNIILEYQISVLKLN